MSDEYDLQRFVRAQDPVYEHAIGILRRGMMCTPYMEFIFPGWPPIEAMMRPNLTPSGRSTRPTPYLSSPLLGGRYRECVGTLQRLVNFSARTVFDDADAQKLHASLTLFSEASYDEFLLETMFDVWFDGLLDEDTMNQVRSMSR